MQCENLISSMSTLIATTANIEKILTLEELEFLIHLGNGAKEPKCLRTILNEHFGAVSYIEPIRDEYNRKGVWNHTIIVNLKEYFESTAPTELLAKSFIRYSANPPKKLEPITLEVPKNVSTPEITV